MAESQAEPPETAPQVQPAGEAGGAMAAKAGTGMTVTLRRTMYVLIVIALGALGLAARSCGNSLSMPSNEEMTMTYAGQATLSSGIY